MISCITGCIEVLLVDIAIIVSPGSKIERNKVVIGNGSWPGLWVWSSLYTYVTALPIRQIGLLIYHKRNHEFHL